MISLTFHAKASLYVRTNQKPNYLQTNTAPNPGALTALCTNPFWVIKTRMCATRASDPNAYKSLLGMIACSIKPTISRPIWSSHVPPSPNRRPDLPLQNRRIPRPLQRDRTRSLWCIPRCLAIHGIRRNEDLYAKIKGCERYRMFLQFPNLQVIVTT